MRNSIRELDLKMITPKPWGEERILHQGYGYAVKKILLNAGNRTSLHYHEVKHEFIYVVEGELTLQIGQDNARDLRVLRAGEFAAISPGTIHRMEAVAKNTAYIESQTDHLEDVVRISDDYTRA